MDKKKVIGLIIFIIMIGIFIKYPDIQEYRFQRSINAMIEKGEYQKAYDSIDNEKIEEFNFYYMSIIKCEFGLGMSRRVSPRIQRLIEDRRTEQIQDLVDSMGTKLGDYLILIDNHFDDLIYSDDLKEYVAQMQYEQGNEGRATYLRGVEEVDIQFMEYLFMRGNFHEFINYYDKVPEYLMSIYNSQMGAVFFQQVYIHHTEKSQEKALEFMDSVKEKEYPREFLKGIAAYGTFLESYRRSYKYLGHDDFLESVFSHSLFTDNPYFSFFHTLLTVSDSESKAMALKELKENPQFKHIEGKNEILKVAESSTLVNQISEVTRENIFFYYDINGNYRYYDLDNKQYLELEGAWIRSVSPQRNYIVATAILGHGTIYVFDGKMNLIETLDDHFEPRFWIDNENLLLIDYSEGESNQMRFNVINKEITEYKENMEWYHTKLDFVPQGECFRLWSFDETKYTIIESLVKIQDHQSFAVPGKKYYTTKTIEDHKTIERIEFDFIFLGSSTEYIYGIDVSTINVLVKMDKTTGEITKLPFYSIVNWHIDVSYLDNYYYW